MPQRLALACLALLLCAPPSPAQVEAPDGFASPMRAFVERYRVDRDALERLYAVEVSATRRERLHALHQERLAALEAMDFAALDVGGRIDWTLMRDHLRFAERELERQAERLAAIEELLPFAGIVVALEEGRRRMQPQEPRASAERVAELCASIAGVREALEARLEAGDAPGPVPARRAALVVDELKRALADWNAFHAAYDPAFTWWLKEPYASAEAALADYAWFLREKLAGYQKDADEPLIGDPIGREALLEHLRAARIPYTPEELIAAGEAELAWCEVEMRRAASDLGFEGDWQRALDHVSALHVEPGQQPALIRALAEEAIDFLEERELVTIPPLAKETWRMEMMSPERQKVTPYFTGGEVISVSYPTDGMSHADKLMSMRGNNVHFSRATVHHELVPGHHLQGFMARRWAPHRRLFHTPFYGEGWALYWEMRLWDLGFARSAEDRVGMLFWRSHRCARIVFSLRFHLGQMTAEQAIDYLVERIGHERRNATAEVRRSVAGDYGPLYQAAYMLGGLQLLALHEELVLSGRTTERAFHDAVLREGPIPIDLVRAALTGTAPAREEGPGWRFLEGR